MTPQAIRDLRYALGLGQTEFAALIGLETRGAISRLETGSRPPTGPTLAMLHLVAWLNEHHPKILGKFLGKPPSAVDKGKQKE